MQEEPRDEDGQLVQQGKLGKYFILFGLLYF